MKRTVAILLAVIVTVAGYQAIRLARASSERETLQRGLSRSASELEAAREEIAALRLTDAALRAQLRALGTEPVAPQVRIAPLPAPDVDVIVPSARPTRPAATPRPTPTPEPCLLGVLCL